MSLPLSPSGWPAELAVFAVCGPLIREFEGYRSKPYLCSAGRPTIGFGTTRYPDGRKVTLADPPCTEPQARAYMESSMARVWWQLQRSGAVMRAPTLHQAAALLSLAYNLGVGAHDGVKGDLADSTLLARFNAGDIAGAAAEFGKWSKVRKNGRLVVEPGLIRRRARERDLFVTA